MCLGHKSLKKTTIQLHNTLALPVLLYGSETWTVRARGARRITAARMKYMRRTAGYTGTDHKTNTQIAKELKITPILDKLLEYKRNWKQHVNRMPRNRIARIMEHYLYRIIILPVFLYGCETWSLTLREECRLRVFENRVLRRVFGPKRDEVTGNGENYIMRILMICTAHPILCKW